MQAMKLDDPLRLHPEVDFAEWHSVMIRPHIWYDNYCHHHLPVANPSRHRLLELDILRLDALDLVGAAPLQILPAIDICNHIDRGILEESKASQVLRIQQGSAWLVALLQSPAELQRLCTAGPADSGLLTAGSFCAVIS